MSVSANFKIRDGYIFYSSQEENLKFKLNYHKVNNHEDFLPLETCMQLEHKLFSSEGDKTLWARLRHPDPETQAFIAWQNAQYANDVAFRHVNLVVLLYRLIDGNKLKALDDIHRLVDEVLKLNDQLSLAPGIRSNKYHLKLSVMYAALLYTIYSRDHVNFIKIINEIFNELNIEELYADFKTIFFNFNKVLMIAYLYSNDSAERLKLTQLSSKLLKHSLNQFDDDFRNEDDIAYLKEFAIPLTDTAFLQAMKNVDSKNGNNYNNGIKIHFAETRAELEEKLATRAVRASLGECSLKQILDSFENKILFNIPDVEAVLDEVTSSNKLNERTVDLIRDAALALEKTNLNKSLELMQLAKKNRPNGPFITKKIEEYQLKISKC